MQNEVRNHLGVEVADRMSALCNAVYSGDYFGDEQFNEFIQIVQNMHN